MHYVDQILFPRWLIPVQDINTEPGQQVLEQHGVAVDNGRIVAVGPRQSISASYSSEIIVDLPQHALTPGLVNAHTHSSMTLLRGYSDDLPLMEWLSQHIWPAEAKWVNTEFVKAGTDLAIAEMIRSGTTCFNDMYFFPDIAASRCELAGMRACVGMIVLDFPTIWAGDAGEYISKGLQVRDDLRHSTLVSVAFAPHAPYTVSNAPLEKVAVLAEELDCQIHIHVHETSHEIEESNARFGMRPLERLDQLGLVGPHLVAVHMTQLLPAEISTLAERGVNVVHCPQSNLKLASGFCPVNSLLEQGINVAIGTDGASSNNDLDMLGEMQSAALLAKTVAEDPAAMNAYHALYAATKAGAISLGLEHEIGSIEVGKSADLVAFDLSDPATQPVFHPVSQLVYSASRNQVSDVWIAGKKLLTDGKLTRMNLQAILTEAREWGLKIQTGHTQ
ncbi:MAG: TRZ/ATZ family hydrolase [bacterium]